ncbi:copper chaperone PCu(A)C [Aureimonas mangrovi]|uniref:copper chaperone PCu(A)C n=1 Tax=Aureimonas mangrovi TaxID=2758041 RepID=UPI001FE3E949|nr:copper chaperone PCu(A)C [Aureimonas mangrovi]
MRILHAASLAAALLTAGSALAHDYRAGSVEIDHPWSRATPPNANVGGGYLTLRNDGEEPDRLIGGSSPAAERVEIHTMEMEGDVMRMRQLPDGVEIPAGGTAELAPGGMHLMLIGLAAPLVEGERVPLTLEFEKAGSVEVELAIDAIGAGGAADAHSGH